MPVDLDLGKRNARLNADVASLRVWFYPAAVDYPATGEMPGGEVPRRRAHFMVFEGFASGRQRGESLGRGSLDTGALTIREALRSGDIDLEALFEQVTGD